MGKEEEGGEVKVLSVEAAQELAKYDLTQKMTPFLDPHLIFPILNFLQESGIYKQEGILRAELKILSETNMLDVAFELCESLGEQAPEALVERRDAIVAELDSFRDKIWGLLQILEDEEQTKMIHSFKTLEEMCAEFKIDASVVDDLLGYAKLRYECGTYELSGQLLKHYRSMPQAADGIVTSKHISAMWGSLASHLLNRDMDEATEMIFKLDEYLENAKAPKREVLLHRAWLLHWTVFAIFGQEKVDPKLLDFFLNEKSLSIISLSCPHLFRYVGACLILQKRLKHLVKDTVSIINHESMSYSDPVTRFLLALYMEMDYDDAQRELQSCELVCQGDFFLSGHWSNFQENARLHIFESYCRIHQCINIQMIAEKLNMQAEEAELWIVKLIQNAKLDARIDSEKSRVVMTKAPPNVYQQVIEKTKNLAFRSTMLVSNLEKEKLAAAQRGDRGGAGPGGR